MEDYKQTLDEIRKTQAKILKLVTTIGKSLNIIPMSKKEFENLNALRIKNGQIMSQVEKENTMFQEVEPEVSNKDVFSDILGDDVLGGEF